MTVRLEGGCQVSDLRDGTSRVRGTLRVFDRVGRALGAQAISLRVLEFAPGLSPVLCNENCDEVLYVMAGSGTASIDGERQEIEPGVGLFLAPGVTLSVENPGPAALVLSSSRCPDPESDERPATSRISTTNARGPRRAAPLVRLADRVRERTSDRWYTTLVGPEVGSDRVTQFVGGIPPGRSPDHFHPYEEVLCILRGTGRMWAGRTHTPIGPGACIYLPQKQVHCVENTGASELVLLGVFYPAGSPAVSYDAGS